VQALGMIIHALSRKESDQCAIRTAAWQGSGDESSG
jgi:hypothetical protein